jgi:hypothetical protein
MPGLSTVVKQPAGKIKMIKFYKTSKGLLFEKDQVLDYYSIFVTTGCSSCGSTVQKKSYRVKGASIPFDKAVILK